MAENTNVGPAGATGPALSPKVPDNHGLADPSNGGGFDQGKGPDADSASLNPYDGPVRNGGS